MARFEDRSDQNDTCITWPAKTLPDLSGVYKELMTQSSKEGFEGQ